MSDKRKAWVVTDQNDPDLPAGIQIGYHQAGRFHCNCSSEISSSGLTPHFDTQKHKRWIQCQLRLAGCRAACGISSPRRPSSPPRR